VDAPGCAWCPSMPCMPPELPLSAFGCHCSGLKCPRCGSDAARLASPDPILVFWGSPRDVPYQELNHIPLSSPRRPPIFNFEVPRAGSAVIYRISLTLVHAGWIFDMRILSPSDILKLLDLSAVAFGLIAMAVVTMPDLSADVRNTAFVVLWCCLAFFAGQLANAASRRWASEKKYWKSASGVIDLAAVLPVPTALLLGVPSEKAWLFAGLWILKLTVFVPGLSTLGRVIVREVRALASVVVLFLTFLTLASVALHAIEGPVQPEKFGSLPLSLWWAVTTLTSTGYGDAVPSTFYGRLIAGFVMISGLAVFGLWTGILANGFAAEHQRRDFIRNWDLVTRVPFLKNLDPPAVIELTRLLRRLDLSAGTTVVRQGRPGDSMYFIVSGEVEVKVDPPIRLTAGAFFGEMALLTGAPRTANVVTTQPTTLLALEVADFHTMTAHHPELSRAVAAEAARRSKPTHGDTAPAQIGPAAEDKPRDRASG
jgi:voltage-gated potassium channel